MALTIMRRQIDIERSEVLYDAPFRPETLERDWRVRSGEWHLEGEWLDGKHPENSPGMIVSRADYFGDVMLEFDARTVAPSTHDINFMWNGSWDETLDRRDVAYVAGLQGWWEGKVGIEKSPQYLLNAGTPLFPFEPGRTYCILGGSIAGHCFICVDGRLAIEVTDPDPIPSDRYGKVGFEAYCSHIQVRNLVIRRIAWTPLTLAYRPEF